MCWNIQIIFEFFGVFSRFKTFSLLNSPSCILEKRSCWTKFDWHQPREIILQMVLHEYFITSVIWQKKLTDLTKQLAFTGKKSNESIFDKRKTWFNPSLALLWPLRTSFCACTNTKPWSPCCSGCRSQSASRGSPWDGESIRFVSGTIYHTYHKDTCVSWHAQHSHAPISQAYV